MLVDGLKKNSIDWETREEELKDLCKNTVELMVVTML